MFETFEQGIPAKWEIPQSRDGASWEVGTSGFAGFPNPGEGNWIYIDDEKNNQVGEASLTTPVFDLSAYSSGIEISFQVNFQEYAGKGTLRVEVWNQQEWWEITQYSKEL